MERLSVEVYSDYTCPWCYVGAARLERLRDRLRDVELDVTWRPFEIHPEVPRGGMPVERLGYPPDQWRKMVEHLRAQAGEEGLEIGSLRRVSNTHAALAAGTYVQDREPDRFPAFHRRLFRAYFAEDRDIAALPVLLEVATESGVDPDALEEALREGRYDDEIRRTGALAGRLGITGTPTFVFAGRYGAVGAQPVETLERVARRALADAA